MSKKILESKTKLGAVLAGVGIIVSSVYAAYEGAIDGATAMEQVTLGAGVILFGIGLRDALSKN